MFNRDLRESRVWLKLLYFDKLCSTNHLLNKLNNHFIILYLYYLQKDCLFIALNKTNRNCLSV